MLPDLLGELVQSPMCAEGDRSIRFPQGGNHLQSVAPDRPGRAEDCDIFSQGAGGKSGGTKSKKQGALWGRFYFYFPLLRFEIDVGSADNWSVMRTLRATGMTL